MDKKNKNYKHTSVSSVMAAVNESQCWAQIEPVKCHHVRQLSCVMFNQMTWLAKTLKNWIMCNTNWCKKCLLNQHFLSEEHVVPVGLVVACVHYHYQGFCRFGSVERDGVVCQSSVTFGSIGTVTTWKKHKWSQSVWKMALRSGLQSQSQYYQQLVGGGSREGGRTNSEKIFWDCVRLLSLTSCSCSCSCWIKICSLPRPIWVLQFTWQQLITTLWIQGKPAGTIWTNAWQTRRCGLSPSPAGLRLGFGDSEASGPDSVTSLLELDRNMCPELHSNRP